MNTIIWLFLIENLTQCTWYECLPVVMNDFFRMNVLGMSMREQMFALFHLLKQVIINETV